MKLAKAADPWSSGLAVFYNDVDGWFIWGMVDQVVHISMAFVGEPSPAYDPPGEFHVLVNNAGDMTVFRKDFFIGRLAQDLLLDEQNDCLWEGPISNRIDEWQKPIWRSVSRHAKDEAVAEDRQNLKFQAKDSWTNTLSRILISIQRQRHGGAILFSETGANEDLSIKYALEYRRISRAMKLALFNGIVLQNVRSEMEHRRFRGSRTVPLQMYGLEGVSESEIRDSEQAITGAVRFISSLAGVDGLVLASPDFTIHGFGVEIKTKKDIEQLFVATSADLSKGRMEDANTFGTRHRSMARYCSARPESIGFVVSQDGSIRAIMKVGDRTILFENIKVNALWGDDLPKQIQALQPKQAGRKVK